MYSSEFYFSVNQQFHIGRRITIDGRILDDVATKVPGRKPKRNSIQRSKEPSLEAHQLPSNEIMKKVGHSLQRKVETSIGTHQSKPTSSEG